MKCLKKHLALVAVICAIGILIGPFSSYAGINEELWYAAREGNTARVKALLAKGADVNAKDNDGVTALMAAVKGGHSDTIKFLKQHIAMTHQDHEMQQDRPTKAGEKVSAKKGSGDDPTYWLNKGAICATYGNDKAAIKHFKKAIQLDPNNASAHFNKGICYGEIGQYDEALLSINKAIDMYPERGSYFYGRGRVYLLSGEKAKAMEDFKRATELDNRDAQNYLQNTLHGQRKAGRP